MWCLRHPPHRQDSAVLRLVTRCPDMVTVLRGVKLKQAVIVESKVV